MKILIFGAVVTVLCGRLAVAQPIIYVDANASGPVHDGSSWCAGFVHLQDALAVARDAPGTVAEIRVADGVYKPDRDQTNPDGTGDRAASFQLVDAVALRGGYAGCGAEDPARGTCAHSRPRSAVIYGTMTNLTSETETTTATTW